MLLLGSGFRAAPFILTLVGLAWACAWQLAHGSSLLARTALSLSAGPSFICSMPVRWSSVRRGRPAPSILCSRKFAVYSAQMSMDVTNSQTSSTVHADRRARASAHKQSRASPRSSLDIGSLSPLSLLVLGLAESLARLAALSPAADRSRGECSGAVPARLRLERPPRPTRDIASSVLVELMSSMTGKAGSRGGPPCCFAIFVNSPPSGASVASCAGARSAPKPFMRWK